MYKNSFFSDLKLIRKSIFSELLDSLFNWKSKRTFVFEEYALATRGNLMLRISSVMQNVLHVNKYADNMYQTSTDKSLYSLNVPHNYIAANFELNKLIQGNPMSLSINDLTRMAHSLDEDHRMVFSMHMMGYTIPEISQKLRIAHTDAELRLKGSYTLLADTLQIIRQ